MEWPHHVNNILAPFTLILPPKDAAHSAHQEHCAGRHLATPGAHAPGDDFFFRRDGDDHAADSGKDACTENTNTAVAASCRV